MELSLKKWQTLMKKKNKVAGLSFNDNATLRNPSAYFDGSTEEIFRKLIETNSQVHQMIELKEFHLLPAVIAEQRDAIEKLYKIVNHPPANC